MFRLVSIDNTLRDGDQSFKRKANIMAGHAWIRVSNEDSDCMYKFDSSELFVFEKETDKCVGHVLLTEAAPTKSTKKSFNVLVYVRHGASVPFEALVKQSALNYQISM